MLLDSLYSILSHSLLPNVDSLQNFFCKMTPSVLVPTRARNIIIVLINIIILFIPKFSVYALITHAPVFLRRKAKLSSSMHRSYYAMPRVLEKGVLEHEDHGDKSPKHRLGSKFIESKGPCGLGEPPPTIETLSSPTDSVFVKQAALSLAGITTIAALFLLNHRYQLPPDFNISSFMEAVVSKVEEMGPNGALFFAMFYILAEVLALPSMPLTASAGYLFGWQEGTALVLFSATIAAAISFSIARTFLRDHVERLLELNPKFKSLDRAIGKEGFKVMLLARLSPIFPFALSNYFYGVTSIDFWPFIFGTLFGFAPGTLAYVYTGQLGKSLIIGDGTSGPLYVYVVGLALVALTLKLITDFATKIIADIEADECSTVETSDSSE